MCFFLVTYIPVRDDRYIDLYDLGLSVISFRGIFALGEKSDSFGRAILKCLHSAGLYEKI